MMDVNGDNTVDMNEFCDVMLFHYRKHLMGNALTMDQLAIHMYDLFDTDGNGEIIVDEVADMLAKLKISDRGHVLDLFHRMDSDRGEDGVVSKEEFIKFIAQHSVTDRDDKHYMIFKQ